MKKKTVIVVFVVIIIASLLTYNFNSKDNEIFEQTFVIDAVYFENEGYAEISFQDKSSQTQHVILEVLGMSESFHKEYSSSHFVEKIQPFSRPQYGWASIPVTFVVEHEEFGKIGIKTEIRPINETQAKIIFTNLS